MTDWTPWVALIGTLFGGVGLKVIENVIDKNRVKQDYDFKYRAELREENQSLRDENQELREEINLWRTRYYNLMDGHQFPIDE